MIYLENDVHTYRLQRPIFLKFGPESIEFGLSAIDIRLQPVKPAQSPMKCGLVEAAKRVSKLTLLLLEYP